MPRVELPTLALTLAVYAAWLALTWLAGEGHAIAFPLLAVVLTLHASLQHEHIHGHPTRHDAVNAWLAGWPLSLWLPYGVYRRSHREHHASHALTDPREDAESFYVEPARFAAMGRGRRVWRVILQTLLGRLLLGPASVVLSTAVSETRRWRALDAATRRAERAGLVGHGLGLIAVLLWLVGCCDVPLWLYVAAAVYPGLSLTLLRSFAEHRPHRSHALRTNVVESPWLGWLFLHNNLHVVHHDEPGLPWYRLRERWRADRCRHRDAGVLVYPGYQSLLRYALSPKDPPVYPDRPAPAPRRPARGHGRDDVGASVSASRS